MFNYHQQGKTEYKKGRYDVLLDVVETSVQKQNVYIDSRSNATIGTGFNLRAHTDLIQKLPSCVDRLLHARPLSKQILALVLGIFTIDPVFAEESAATTKELIPYEGARPIRVYAGQRPSYAIDYELTFGKGVEVCEAYKKNLDSIVQDQTCERQVNPELKDFAKPRWQTLDAWQHRELIRRIEKFLQSYPSGNPEENLPEWEKSIKDVIGNGHLRLEIADIDIDNDGKPELVLKYHDGKCLMAHMYATLLFVLNAAKDDLDILKTMHLMRSRVEGMPYPRLWSPAGIWGDTLYDAFVYKGKTYFDKDEIGYSVRQRVLHVFNTDGRSSITEHLCTYRLSVPPLPGQN